MKIAITGGTGFVGGHLARTLLAEGHEVVLIARGFDKRDEAIRNLPRVRLAMVSLEDESILVEAFAGCDAVAHCAGINRENGKQTYERVHVEGTRHVVNAATRAGVKKAALISFLRARPNCGSGYHESKWAAEEIVRASGLDYAVLKCGVIYGTGDHMLDHLSHAFYTFPVFALVGFEDKPMRPTAVEDVVRILVASLIDGRLSRQTVAVMGPEEMELSEAVRRVARVVGKKPWYIPMPLWFHYALGWCLERIMKTPLVSIAQVRILSEGIVEAMPACEPLTGDLQPKLCFTDAQIRGGLPVAGAFGIRDFRCCVHKQRIEEAL
jgi:NADH dehydrogenase